MIPKREEAIKEMTVALMAGVEEPIVEVATSIVDMIEATRDSVCTVLAKEFREARNVRLPSQACEVAAVFVEKWLEKAKLEGTPTS